MRVSELFEATKFNRYDLHDFKDLAGDDDTDVYKLADTIKANCKTMLKACQQAGKPLYRGVANADMDVIMTGIRSNRRPVEMPIDRHNDLKKVFTEMGLTANRSNSIFTSPVYRVADGWGQLCAVFIKDGWSATVFDKYCDGYSYDYFSNDAFLRDYQKGSSGLVKKNIGARNITTTAELARVVKNNYYEIMFTGDSYIAVSIKYKNYKKLLKLLEII